MFGVGRIADETRHICEVVEATSAEARSVCGEVESKVATLAAKAGASTTHTVEEMTGCVWEVAPSSDAQVSHVAETVTQQLEWEIQAM